MLPDKPDLNTERNGMKNIRNEVQSIKSEILRSFENRCYACDFDCKPILIIHHILPISKGGDNDISNLVSLCPNCHAIIHKITSETNKIGVEDDISYLSLPSDLRQLSDWMTNILDANQGKKLIAIAEYARLDNK